MRNRPKMIRKKYNAELSQKDPKKYNAEPSQKDPKKGQKQQNHDTDYSMYVHSRDLFFFLQNYSSESLQ